MNITIIADSKRHEMLAEGLIRDGHAVTLFQEFESLPEEITADIIILPILGMGQMENTVTMRIFPSI